MKPPWFAAGAAAMLVPGLAACGSGGSGTPGGGAPLPGTAAAAATRPSRSWPGKSYQSCLACLMPGDGSTQRIQWADGPHRANQVTPYFDHPITWGAG
jgi:hypothetical protein